MMHHVGRWRRPFPLMCVVARFRNGLYGGDENALLRQQNRSAARTFLLGKNRRRSFVRGDKRRSNFNNVEREINSKLVALGKQQRWKDLLQVYRMEKLRFSDVNYSTIMSQLARIRHLDTQDATLLELVDDLPQQLKHFKARNIGTTANALAKLRMPKHTRHLTLKFMAELDTVSERLFEERDCRNIALSVHASAKANVSTPKLIASLDRNADWFLQNGNPQEIANSVWACATMDIEAPQLFQGLDKQSVRLLREGNAQDISNLAWACATLGVPVPQFFKGLDHHSDQLLRDGSPQNIANSVWACATLGVRAPKLFEELDKRGDMLIRGGNSQEIANSVWACATLGVRAPDLFKALDHHSDRLLRDGSPQEIANSLWACGTLRVKAPELFDGLDKHIDRLLRDDSQQEIANSMWACAVVNHWPAHLVGKCVSSLIESGSTIDLVMYCWSLLVLLVTNAEDSIDAFQCMKVTQGEIRRRLSTPGGRLGLTKDTIQQVLTIEAVGTLYGIPLEPLLPSLPTESLLMDFSDAETTKSSCLHRKISYTLSELGFDHEVEVSPFPISMPGTMAIDIASHENRIAVEVDGPSHFLYSPDFSLLKEYNGSSIFKRRILERLGWKVINIDYRDASLHGCSQKWLGGLLEHNGVHISNNA